MGKDVMTAITNAAVPAMGHHQAYGSHGGAIWERAIPVAGLSADQIKAIQKIASFDRLPTNWDSYGSPRISDTVIDSAIELVVTSFGSAPMPRILPVSGGSIQFEWEMDGRELEIEIRPDLNGEVLLSMDGEQIEVPKDISSVEGLVSWLIYGR